MINLIRTYKVSESDASKKNLKIFKRGGEEGGKQN